MASTHRNELPHWIFWIIGGLITIISVLTGLIEGRPWNLISDISLNIGITVLAVGIIDWIWRRIGGDPLMSAINELRTATTLLADLRDTGLKRLFISREHASERRRYLKSKMSQASEVDMMGINLRSGWISDPDFKKLLQKQTMGGEAKFRIMILDPGAQMTAQRAFEEDYRKSGRIAETASESLRILQEIKSKLPVERQDSLLIKVINETNIYCAVIRVDDLMMVTNYLMHVSGGNSETIEIEGEDGSLFKLFMAEFNAMWDRAAFWSG
ncbi:MAG: hypothetical protein ACXADH_02775 [Candidatus Kariarchaeaceae archaeon]|jgi:hypothetical protein